MLNVSKLKSMLNAGQQVILVKAAKGPHPTSYSIVTRYEGDNIWRTAFEAESPDEVYDFDIRHYTFSKDLSNNPRVSIYGVATERYDSCDDDSDYEEDEYDTEVAPVRRNAPVDFQAQRIRELENQIWNLQNQAFVAQLNKEAVKTPVQRTGRRTRVSI